MGKNSLIKSTSKKKKNLKKPEDPKQPEKKIVAAVGGEAEPVAKPTYRDLIFKKFTDRQPGKPSFTVSQEKKRLQYEAPPFYSTAIHAEIKRFKALLFKKFDLTSPAETGEEETPVDENAGQPTPAVETAPAEIPVEIPVKIIAHPIKPTPPLKRIAPEQKVFVSYGNEKAAKPSDPRDNMVKLAVALFAFFVLAVVGASFSNHGTYWLVSKNGKTEVWQGRFGPMGKVLLMTLPDAVLTGNGKTSGSKKEIFPVIVAWHLNKADKGLEIAGTPDFKEIRSLLSSAEPFAATPELKKEILIRSNVIDLMALLYKAQVAASLETAEGFERALSYLEEAKSLQTDEIQVEWVSKKISQMEKKLADLGLPASSPKPKPEPKPEKDK